MNASTKVQYRGGHPEYTLLLNGAVIGTVRAYRTTYNLRRYLVDKGWTATSADGQHSVGSDYTDTRRSAVQGLLDALGLVGEA